MAIVLVYRGRGLRYWFPNNNFYGSLKDIIGFSLNSYFIFDTLEQAENKKKNMLIDFYGMEGEVKLSFKVYNIINSLKVIEVSR
jgi:hypothetical protein